MGLELTNEEAEPLIKAMVAAADDTAARDPKWKAAKEINTPWGPWDKQADGTLVDNPDKTLIRIKRKTEKKYRGELTKQDPFISGIHSAVLLTARSKVGWGSIVKVSSSSTPTQWVARHCHRPAGCADHRAERA